VKVPDYLEAVYWWAYVRPWAIKLFERDWLVGLILWGWYRPLEDAALEMVGESLPGRTLQIACVYGEFVPKLWARVEAAGGELDVVDVVPAQLENLKNKLPRKCAARLLQMDSSDMALPSASYDRVVLFFLMHEQPSAIRQRTISEAFRVVKPGGQVLFVEFSKAKWWHPLRYIYLPILKHFEPFAPDVWDHDDVEFWLTKPFADKIEQRRLLFGNYYQVFSVRA
jgi:ubiquinone/menaquinone biosynthesis C-methylase UbiE